jgi:hypothetical protein
MDFGLPEEQVQALAQTIEPKLGEMLSASIRRCRDAARLLRAFLRHYGGFCEFLGEDLLGTIADVMRDGEAESKKEMLEVVAEWMSWPDEQLVMRLAGLYGMRELFDDIIGIGLGTVRERLLEGIEAVLRGQGQARFLMFDGGVEEMLGALLDDEVCGDIAQALLDLVPGS